MTWLCSNDCQGQAETTDSSPSHGLKILRALGSIAEAITIE